MKKLIALLLATLMLLPLASCGGESLSTATEGEQTATQTTEAPAATEEPAVTGEQEKVDTKVAEPLTWEKLNSIPVANENMTERELRQICLDFMELQLTFPWTPNETVHIRKKDHKYGDVYGGMPYVSSTFNNLYQLMKYYDTENGMMDIKAMGKNVETIMGNQCSANSFWGWARVSNTMTWGGTSNITESRGAIFRGNRLSSYMKANYPDLANYNDLRTADILRAMGKDVVYEGYAQLLAADGLVYNNQGSGHVMMVYEDAVVKYNANGTIADDSYVVVQHQTTGEWAPAQQSDGTAIELAPGWRSQYTFQHLMEGGYLPFTLAELIGTDPVEPTEMTFSITTDKVSISKLILATVTANYALSDVTVVITDAEGKELSRQIHCSYSGDHFRDREMTLSAMGFRRDLYSAYEGKGYTITILGRTGKGDQIQIYSGELVK